MKNKKLNKLLMAASSLAILAGGASSAMAAPVVHVQVGADAHQRTGVDIRSVAGVVPQATLGDDAGDTLHIGVKNGKFTRDARGFASINLYGNSSTILFGSDDNGGPNGTKAITIVNLTDNAAQAAVTLANNNTAIKPGTEKNPQVILQAVDTGAYVFDKNQTQADFVKEVDFDNKASSIKFIAASNGVDMKANFKSTGAGLNGKGVIEVDANTAITLSSTFDQKDRVRGLKLTTSKATINTDLYLGTGGISFTGAAAEVVVNKGKIVDVTTIAANANNNGILTFEGDATVFINDGKIADIAVNGSALAEIKLGDGSVTFTKDAAHEIAAAKVSFTQATSGLVFDKNQHITIKGDLDITSDGYGKIIADSLADKTTLTVTGKIGANDKHLGLISAKKGGIISLETTDAQGQYIKKIETAGATDVSLQLKAANAGAVYKIADFSHSDNVGTLKIASGDATHIVKLAEGTVLSTDKNRLKSVEFASNGNNATLEFGKNVSLHTDKGVTTVTANEGSLLFGDGEHVVAGTVGTKDKPLNLITSNFASNKVTFTDNVYSSKIIFGANSNETSAITFGKNVTEVIVGDNAGITTTAAGKGVLAFANEKALVIDAKVIGDNALKAISIEGNNVTSKNLATLSTGEIRFVGENSTAILDISSDKAIDLAGTKITTESTNRSNHIIVQGNQAITGAVGASNKAFGEIRVKNDVVANNATVTLSNPEFYASVTPNDKDQVVNVTLANAVSILGLGAKDRMLNEVSGLAGNKFENKGDTYVKTFTIEDTKVYTLGGTIQTGTDVANNGQGLRLEGEDAEVIFADKAIVNGFVVANNDEDGIVKFAGSATLNAQLGDATNKLNSIEFSAEEKATVKIQNDVYAAGSFAGKSTIDFSQKDRAFNSELKLEGTKLALGTSNIKFAKVEIQDAMTLEVHATNDKAGRMTLVDGLVAAPTTAGEKVKVSINLVDDSDLVSGKTYTIVENDAKATTKVDFVKNADKIDVDFKSEGQRFTKWGMDIQQDKIIVTSANNVAGALNEITKGLEGVNADYITAFANSAGSDVVRDLGRLPTDTDIRKAVQQLTTTTNQTATNIATVSMTNMITNRASVSAVPVQLTEVGAGVAAGDELSANYGAWMMPFMGKSHQKKSGSIAGYNAKTKGGVIGGDAQVNDGLVLGAAFGLADSKVKHKDIKAGDKTDSKMKMVSVYGTQRLNDNMFVQGMIGYGWGNVTNKEGRTEVEGDAGNRKAVSKIAVGKYKNKVGSVEVLGGYDYRIDSVTITPMVGVGYSKFNDGGYTETGTRNQNRTVAKRKLDKVEGIVGIRLASTQDFSGVIATPEVHAFTRISNSKSPNVKTTLSGVADQLVIKGAKQSKAVYNLGTSVTAKSGSFDYGVGYDLTKSKAVDHTTYLKLRVNF